MGRKKASTGDASADALIDELDAGDTPPPEVEITVTAAAATLPPVIVSPPIVSGPLDQYRVKKSKHISLSGAMTTLSEGDIVSAASHGPIGMARILDSGVELEKL